MSADFLTSNADEIAPPHFAPEALACFKSAFARFRFIQPHAPP
jgi:hypothetical protein